MDEYVTKQKIQKAYNEPPAPQELIDSVILRAQAVTMGVDAQKQLETTPVQNAGELASRVMIGQLAAVSELPKGAEPEQLARQLEQEPAFQAALQGGNVAGRLHSGQLLQQVVQNHEQTNARQMGGETPLREQPDIEQPQIEVPVKDIPKLPGMG